MSPRTTESDAVGDVWTAEGKEDLVVEGKFNDWCLLMRFRDDSHVGVWPLVDLAACGYTKGSR